MNTAPPTSEHRRAWDTIPWFVAGSADAAASALLQQHLPGCAECRAELAFQQRVHDGMNAARAEAADPEAGLQRMLARLDVADAEQAATPERRVHGWTRWLAAAVLVQAVGLAAAGMALYGRDHDSGDYRTLSSPPVPAAPASVRLVPAPGMDFATLRQLLAQARLAVVEAAPDGSSLGLAPLDGDPRTTVAALPLLRAQPGVLLAEPTAAAR